jgi:uncharacterized protein YcnI
MEAREYPMHSAGKNRRATAVLIVWGGLLGLAIVAWGHVDIEPRQSIPNRWETYTLNVPTETEAPTVGLRLVVPSEFEVEAVKHSPAWQIATVRDARGYIREVHWSGSTIPPQTFEEFKFLARNPTTAGTYRWSIEQVYQHGDPATWEAQTRIMAPEQTGKRRDEEAWHLAQVAITVSLVALGIAIMLIIITGIGIVQNGRRQARGGDV